ncbi:hypothetical protein [Clostridium estertheticum]|uniref:Uncharacterized protein n=1 Tax=Clostridium estertheticum TaxID=238834 RepID=A0A7Y3T3G3_9CLOT|nr:hypothetical protein [Clostridium estertheticum]NNU78589.1 hypothetical protein [Clostridium estertheticum]WBL49679.1 hypothetical protein LOR37_23260 [Clostridium estertheticum]
MKSNSAWHKANFSKDTLLIDIVSSATLSNIDIADGKTIPLVILNTEAYDSIRKSINMHKGIITGHVDTIWGKSRNEKYFSLNIDIIDPSPISFTILFDLSKQAGLIDLIIYSQLLYIQPGIPGDRFKSTMNENRLLLEVPSTHFKEEWMKVFNKYNKKLFIKMGYSKTAANQATNDLNKEWDKVREMRMKG